MQLSGSAEFAQSVCATRSRRRRPSPFSSHFPCRLCRRAKNRLAHPAYYSGEHRYSSNSYRENTAFAVLPNSLDRLPILRRISTGRQARFTFVPATQIFPLHGMSIAALARKAFSTCSKKKTGTRAWNSSGSFTRRTVESAGPSTRYVYRPVMAGYRVQGSSTRLSSKK